MSVSENVAKQVCAIDQFIGKYSILLINQFILGRLFWFEKYLPNAVAVQSQVVRAQISFVQYIIF